MICPNCGKGTENNFVYCRHCGNEISQENTLANNEDNNKANIKEDNLQKAKKRYAHIKCAFKNKIWFEKTW